MSKFDPWAGLVLVGLAALIIQGALDLDYYSEYGLGPGVLPLWLGIGILTISLLMIARRIWGSPDPEKKSWSWPGSTRSLATWGGLMVAIALLKLVGFTLSFVLLTLFLVVVMERRPALISLILALSGAFSFYLIFAVLLGVPLPRGPWGF